MELIAELIEFIIKYYRLIGAFVLVIIAITGLLVWLDKCLSIFEKIKNIRRD